MASNDSLVCRSGEQFPWNTWRHFPRRQQPNYTDPQAACAISQELGCRPPLVQSTEVGDLRQHIAAAGRGDAFLLMGGDCAESFEDSTSDHVRMQIQTLCEMAEILEREISLPIVKIGRIAGQYAKPRSVEREIRNGVSLPTYRGDAVNSIEFTAEARMHDPGRLLSAYDHAATKLQLIRDFDSGSPARTDHSGPPEPVIYCSHEALLLEYESAMVRVDDSNGGIYDSSGHFLWIGERTRDTDGAHVELCSQIQNPIGVKISSEATRENVLKLIDRLNPHGEEGRLSFITRLGAGRVRDYLPALIEAANGDGRPVTWITDPMHANTIQLETGVKTRFLESIISEIRDFVDVHRRMGTVPAGIHIELTGKGVTEVTDGGRTGEEGSLLARYETLMDPRLNHRQSLALSHRVAGFLSQREPI